MYTHGVVNGFPLSYPMLVLKQICSYFGVYTSSCGISEYDLGVNFDHNSGFELESLDSKMEKFKLSRYIL